MARRPFKRRHTSASTPSARDRCATSCRRTSTTKLVASIRLGKKLDLDIAPVVAQVIKEWAISRGVTHFTHWFQPQTGLTAEKHDAFLDASTTTSSRSRRSRRRSSSRASRTRRASRRAACARRGKRAATRRGTRRARCSSSRPAATRTLCIPSVFIGYNGEALDEMTPLLRSSDVLSEKAIALLELLGDKGVQRVYTTLGAEQEYFLIDRAHFAHASRPRDGRPHARRRAAAARPAARGPLLRRHPRARPGVHREVEHELYKLGVPIVTRHNEVAPCQFEMAPIFEETDIAVDHNQLVMAMLRKVALRHGLQARAAREAVRRHQRLRQALQLVAVDRGRQPGARRHQPAQAGQDAAPEPALPRLPRGGAQGRAQARGAAARRHRVRSGNEHRLGANEAPPAIISVFMGAMLTQVIEDDRRPARRRRTPSRR